MTEPTVIRASGTTNYAICARRWAASAIGREIEALLGIRFPRSRTGVGALKGTTCHHAVAHGYTEKAQTGTLTPISVLLDVARDHLAESFRQGEVEFDGPSGVTHNQNQAMRQVASMVAVYENKIAQFVDPVIVEERLEAEIEPGLVLSGQTDLVCREPHAIRDLKTGQRQPASFAPQLGSYSLLCRSNGIDIQHVNIDFVRSVSVHKPQPDPVVVSAEINQAETAAASILKHIAADLKTFREGDQGRGIKPGDPWAFVANPSCTLCSPKYCRAFGTPWCREGGVGK
jgi:hypothetical protein